LEVQWASQTTISAVERAGGRIRLAYYDKDSLAAAVNPRAFFEKGQPIPRRKCPPHSLMAFYMNPKNRG
jgi:large subunit ribosomal protein L15